MPSPKFTPSVGPSAPRLSVGEGEVRLWCPRQGCEWTTVRPEHAAWSAQEAHKIRHKKGML